MERPGGANQAARGGAQRSPMPGIALCAGIARTARLLQALEAVPPRESIDVPLPGTSTSVYDGLTDCL